MDSPSSLSSSCLTLAWTSESRALPEVIDSFRFCSVCRAASRLPLWTSLSMSLTRFWLSKNLVSPLRRK